MVYVSSNSSWCQLTFLKGNEQFHLVSSFVLNHIGAAGIKARTQQMAMPILILLYFSGSDVVEFDLRGNCWNLRQRRRSRLTRTKLLMEAQSRITSIEVITWHIDGPNVHLRTFFNQESSLAILLLVTFLSSGCWWGWWCPQSCLSQPGRQSPGWIAAWITEYYILKYYVF